MLRAADSVCWELSGSAVMFFAVIHLTETSLVSSQPLPKASFPLMSPFTLITVCHKDALFYKSHTVSLISLTALCTRAARPEQTSPLAYKINENYKCG